ncbi:MAG: hypothetical protein KatS3mg108_2595 [Isosphaeraceae bacterium]|nr:MAG: hypothetical protein KatS3mg108_2595 [Isosphaeraceae bacterium]
MTVRTPARRYRRTERELYASSSASRLGRPGTPPCGRTDSSTAARCPASPAWPAETPAAGVWSPPGRAQLLSGFRVPLHTLGDRFRHAEGLVFVLAELTLWLGPLSHLAAHGTEEARGGSTTSL